MLIGLVGKPSSGKSTFFQAATMVSVPRAAYPFTTIEPNRGMGYTRIDCIDTEFGVQCNPRRGYCIKHQRFIQVELLDVAGLVPGAHEGKGLGNKFLDDLRSADALIHIVDASGSTNEKGESVEPGSYDPINDIKFLEEEIGLWIYDILKRGFDRVRKEQRIKKMSPEDALGIPLTGLNISPGTIKPVIQNKPNKLIEWSEEDLREIAMEIQRIGKPIIIAANKCDKPTAKKNIERMQKKFPNRIIIPTSAELELALKEASKKEYIEYLPGDTTFKIIKDMNEKQKNGLNFTKNIIENCEYGTGIQKILNTIVFDVLKYNAIFPGGVNKLTDSKGNVLPDVFLMPPNSTAKDFAGTIHSDFADKFIKAIDVRTKRAHGADYILKNRDILEIVFRK